MYEARHLVAVGTHLPLCPLINALKEEIHRAIKTQLCNNWNQTLQNLDTSNFQDTWRIHKHLTNDAINIPLFKLNDKLATTEQQRLKLFSDTLQGIFTTNADVNSTYIETAGERF